MEQKLFLDYAYGKLCVSFHPAHHENIVIFCHGLASSKASRSHQALRPLLHKDGIATLAVDLYAHGESDGTFEQLAITKAWAGLQRAHAFATEKGYRRIILVGSSFSGVIGLLGASQLSNVVGLVLKCPVFDYQKLWKERLGETGLNQWKHDGSIEIWNKRIGYVFYEDALRYDMPSIARGVHVPVLFIHGDHDTLVPLAHSEEAYALVGGEKSLHIIKGADHLFKQLPHFKELIAVSHAWIRSHFLG